MEVPNQKQNQFQYQLPIILREEKEDKTKPVALAICEIFYIFFMCIMWESGKIPRAETLPFLVGKKLISLWVQCLLCFLDKVAANPIWTSTDSQKKQKTK